MGAVVSCIKVALMILFLPLALVVVIPYAIGEELIEHWRPILKTVAWGLALPLILPFVIALMLGDAFCSLLDTFNRLRSSIRRRARPYGQPFVQILS